MITAALLWLFRTILEGLDYLLPSWSPPDVSGSLAPVVSAMADVGSWVAGANYYFPVAESGLALALLVLVWPAGLLYRGVVWTLTKVHVLGGQ